MTPVDVPAGLARIATALDLELGGRQLGQLAAYVELLLRWNRTYNLTAIREPSEVLAQHLADCLAVVEPIRRRAPATARRVLDVGSGGGLPGLVLAILQPASEVTCIDAVGKKAAFVRQAAAELQLPNLKSRHGRVEQVVDASYDLVVSRAFASLADFVALSSGARAPGGVWVAMKGKLPSDEIDALPSSVRMFHVEQLRVPGLDADRCLVWLEPRGDE